MKPNVMCAHGCLRSFQKINRSLLLNKNGCDIQPTALGKSSSTSQTKKKKKKDLQEVILQTFVWTLNLN